MEKELLIENETLNLDKLLSELQTIQVEVENMNLCIKDITKQIESQYINEY